MIAQAGWSLENQEVEENTQSGLILLSSSKINKKLQCGWTRNFVHTIQVCGSIS